MIKKNTLILFLLSISLCAFTQNNGVKGKVISSEDNLGIPGVSVFISGTTKGTSTDIDGDYHILSVQKGDTLEFHFIGYLIEKKVYNGQERIDVTLKPNVNELNEVVVTALGIERQSKELGYLTQKVDGEVIAQSSTDNVLSALAGRAAGVQVSNGNGVDGGSTRITIRGNNNLTTNNQPLIVVDGVPMENIPGLENIGRGTDWGNALNNLNAFDIEEQTILSGGQASALYGSRGANGVIEIRTKRGVNRKGIGVEYNFMHKINSPYRFRDVQNEYGHGGPVSLSGPTFYSTPQSGDTLLYPQIFSGNVIIDQEGSSSTTSKEFGYYGDAVSWGPKMNGQMIKWWDGEMRPYTPQPNNYKSIYKTGYTTTHNISASGGSEKGSMRVSITREDHTPIIENSNYDQTTFNMAGNLKLSEKITVDMAFTYINYNRLNSPELGDTQNSFSKGYLYSWGRSYKGLDKENYELENGTRNPQEGYPWHYVSNSLWWNYYNNNTQQSRDKYIGSLSFNYGITTWLNLFARVGRDFTLSRFETRNKPTEIDGIQDGYYGSSLNRNYSNNLDIMLAAQKDNLFGSNFNLKFTIGGASWEQELYSIGGKSGTWYYPNFYSFDNFTNPEYEIQGNTVIIHGDSPSNVKASESIIPRKTNSLFSFLNLSYKDYLFLDLTGRNDISSTLPSDNNSYFYPSVSLSFIASEAFNLYDKVKWLSFLKIRGGAAQTATDASPFQTEFYYTNSFFGSVETSSFPSTIPPHSLKPQRVNSYEGGLTIGLFDNKIDFDLTYYYIYSFDQIIPGLPVPASSGANAITTNDGIVSNRGIEIVLNTVPIRTNKFIFKTGINFSRNRNKIISLGGNVPQISIGDIWGSNGPEMLVREGEDYGTISGWDYVYHENGQPILNDEGTHYKLTDTRVPVGNAAPDFLAGWYTEFSYKGFRLSTLIDTKWGGDIYSGSYVIGLQTGQSPETLKERNGGGLPYTDPNGNTSNVGVILPGVYEDGTPNDKVVHYYYKYMPNAGGWGEFLTTPGIVENTWVKMREIRLGYTFNQKIIEKLKIFQNLTFSIVGRDLFYIYTTLPDNINPEGIMGSGNAQGFEWASTPGTRSFTFSIKANF